MLISHSLIPYLHLLLINAFSVLTAGKCFTCVDKDRCPKLMTIYSNDDHCLYKGAVNQKFPECCGISPPTPNSCVVCRDRNNITIVCSEEVRRVEVEDSNGEHILNVSPGCMYDMNVLKDVHTSRLN